MATRDLTLSMVGFGGDGVITIGEMIAQVCASEGLNVIKVEMYGPQIRGGESSCTVRISSKRIYSQGDNSNLLVIFNGAAFSRFRGEILPAEDAIVLVEEADSTAVGAEELNLGENGSLIQVPFVAAAKAAAKSQLAKNILTLGMIGEMCGLDADRLIQVVEQKFKSKPEKVLEANRKGFWAGVELAKNLEVDTEKLRLEYEKGEPKLPISGNHLCAIAAIHAGCKFFAGYPITPSSEILHFMAEWLPKVGGFALQTEDELAAIGSVIGASFAGAKAMTSTSGPGLALMTEMLSLASCSEIPVVIVDVQRGGPSTGLPTKNEQSDLFQALWGSHGDAPRVVLAPSDVEDCFPVTVKAFNIAEKYQIPVIVLSDQNIAQRTETVSFPNMDIKIVGRRVPTLDELEDYKRYQITSDGVSPMSYPGVRGGEYQTTGLEHDEHGRPSSMHVVHEKMNKKRYQKIKCLRDEVSNTTCASFGSEDADVGILCWGSSKGPVLEAMENMRERGEKVAVFVPQMLYPFPSHQFENFIRKVKEIIVIELSYSAQFYKYLRTFLNLPEHSTRVYKRSGGKNLTVGEVEAVIEKVLPLTALKKEILI